MDLRLEGNDIIGFIDGTIPSPDKFDKTGSEMRNIKQLFIAFFP